MRGEQCPEFALEVAAAPDDGVEIDRDDLVPRLGLRQAAELVGHGVRLGQIVEDVAYPAHPPATTGSRISGMPFFRISSWNPNWRSQKLLTLS